jgi:hypothetical protein
LSTSRIVAIGFIYGCTAMAWFILAGSIVQRTGESDARLAQEVAQLWGGRHTQAAPDAWIERPRLVVEDVEEKDDKGHVARRKVTKTVRDAVPVPIDSSRIEVGLTLAQRKKGLLWYDTGLTVTVGAVVTLFVLMQLTGGIDWAEVLERRNDQAPSR